MGPYISPLGMATLMALGVALSKDRRAINPRTVASAFLLLVAVAAATLANLMSATLASFFLAL